MTMGVIYGAIDGVHDPHMVRLFPDRTCFRRGFFGEDLVIRVSLPDRRADQLISFEVRLGDQFLPTLVVMLQACDFTLVDDEVAGLSGDIHGEME